MDRLVFPQSPIIHFANDNIVMLATTQTQNITFPLITMRRPDSRVAMRPTVDLDDICMDVQCRRLNERLKGMQILIPRGNDECIYVTTKSRSVLDVC